MEVQENKTFISLCERCTPCLTASRSPSIPCEPEGIQIWFCSDDTLPGAALLLGVPDSLLPSVPPQGGLCSGAVPGSGKFSCSCWTVTGFEVLACGRCRPWGPWGPMAAAVWDPRGSFCVVSGLLWGPSTQSPIRFWPFACTQSWVLPLLHPTQCVHHLPVPVSILRLPLGKLTSLLQFRAPTVHPAPGLFLGSSWAGPPLNSACDPLCGQGLAAGRAALGCSPWVQAAESCPLGANTNLPECVIVFGVAGP